LRWFHELSVAVQALGRTSDLSPLEFEAI